MKHFLGLAFLSGIILVLAGLLIHQHILDLNRSKLYDDANVALRQGHIKEAQDGYRSFLRSDDRVVSSLNYLGSARVATGSELEALPYYEVAMTLGSLDALKCVAFINMQHGRMELVKLLMPALVEREAESPELALVVAVYAASIQDKAMFQGACSYLTFDFLKQHSDNLQSIRTASILFNDENLIQKYTEKNK
jgi:hypothetical protein